MEPYSALRVVDIVGGTNITNAGCVGKRGCRFHFYEPPIFPRAFYCKIDKTGENETGNLLSCDEYLAAAATNTIVRCYNKE